MPASLFFYDLETSGVNPVHGRIMQFAGQRTDMTLKPIGEPVNVLVRLPNDVLPDPEAVLVHGITPQRANQDGIDERELARRLQREVFTPGTIAVGFNNIRFDDEFIRHLFWRTFYDPYEWQWKDDRSRWDLLDVSRLVRALRPEGMNWGFDEDGNPTNRLVSLAAANNVELTNAHDALADITATIEIARIIKRSQPKMFDYLLNLRDKRLVSEVVSTGSYQPFVYASGRYPSEFLKTTVAVTLGPLPADGNRVLVYDLRHDPKPFIELGADELKKRIYLSAADREITDPLPVKKLALNKCPAVAPLGTLDAGAQKRIQINMAEINRNLATIKRASPGFADRVIEAFAQAESLPQRSDPEGQLYDKFLEDTDKKQAVSIVKADETELGELELSFSDKRLETLFLRYKARNLPHLLSEEERLVWEGWRTEKLLRGVDGSLTLSEFARRLQNLAQSNQSESAQFLLQELQLYAESIAPDQLFDAA